MVGRNTGAGGKGSWLVRDLKSLQEGDFLFQLDTGDNPNSPTTEVHEVCF